MALVLNRATGLEIARSDNLESAFLTAIRLGFANSDMMFVKDDNDVRIYELAVKIASSYVGVPEFYTKKHYDFLAYEASKSLDLWTRVRMSRVSLRYTETATALDEIIGEELAADVELLACVSELEVAKIIYPLFKCKFREAYRDRYLLASRLNRQIVAAKHQELGVIVVAPEEYVSAGSDRFVNLAKQSSSLVKTA